MYIYTHVYGGVHKRVNEFSEQVRGRNNEKEGQKEGGREG